MLQRHAVFFSLSILFTHLTFAQTATAPAGSKAATDINLGTDSRLTAILPSFEKYAADVMKEAQTPGMVIGVVKDGKLIYAKGFGVKKIGTNDAPDPDTLFQIGSISKTFTSALTAQLIDKNLLQWSDHVIDHYPQFMLYDPVVTREFTVKDLYAQDSGLPEHALETPATLGYDTKYLLSVLRYVKPITSFRSEYAYQNILFASGAELMKQVSGKDWHTLLQENILNPLEMKNTGATMPFYKNAKNASALHKIENNKVEAYPIDAFGESVYYDSYAPAGGILSTVRDMSHWAIMQLNKGEYNGKKIISEKNIRIMHEPQTIAREMYDVWSYYALGWVYNEYTPYSLVWHNGGTGGARSMLMLVPHENLAIIVLSNLAGTQVPEAIAYQFIDMYFDNKQTKTWSVKLKEARDKAAAEKKKPGVLPAIPAPALALSTYAGTYENKIFGKMKIIEKNNQLVLVLGPQQFEMPLRHVYRDVFTMQDASAIESLPDQSQDVVFAVDSSGKATNVNIEMFNADSDGHFTRAE